jgi:hypothetical protein
MVGLKTRGFGPAPMRKLVSTRLRACRAVQRRKHIRRRTRQEGEPKQIFGVLRLRFISRLSHLVRRRRPWIVAESEVGEIQKLVGISSVFERFRLGSRRDTFL